MRFFDRITMSGRNARRKLVAPVAVARVLVRLAGGWNAGWVRHWPTWGQVRAMAFCDGREPCSYLLDRDQNFVPGPDELLVGDEAMLGTHALCFRCVRGGQLMELVTMRHGGAFDLLCL